MKTMVTPAEALELVLAHTGNLPTETTTLDHVFGRTLAHDITSDIELPPFANSSMDGYALRHEDVAGASETAPVQLKVIETIAAGASPQHEVGTGECARIMTGAPLPGGADAVIMREETDESDKATVKIVAEARAGQNIRRAGSDVRRGEVVLKAGEIVRAAQWGMLASLGYTEVEVSRQPRVAIITTGDEVVPPGQELKPGQIRDSNSFSLRGLLHATGALCEVYRVGDDPAVLREKLVACGQKFDAIITSGGVSAGDFDPVRDILPEVATVHFWKIAMKPGKPVMFATLKESNVLVFGLPGNPVSVMVAFEQFVRPALLKMQRRRAVQRVEVEARVASALRSPAGKVEYMRAKVTMDSSGRWVADVTGDQGSGRLSTMTGANALLVVPAEVSEVPAGASLRAQMTDWIEVEKCR